MPAGKIQVSVEASIDKLDGQLSEAERRIATSTERMHKTTQSGFGKMAKSGLKMAGAVGIITAAMSLLTGGIKLGKAAWQGMTGTAEESAAAAQKAAEAMKSIPVLGSIYSVMEGLANEIFGINERNLKVQQALELNERARIKNAAILGQWSASKESIRATQTEIDVLNTTNEKRKIELRLRQELHLITERDYKKQTEMLALGKGHGTGAMAHVRKQFEVEKQLARLKAKQAVDAIEAQEAEEKKLVFLEKQREVLTGYVDKMKEEKGWRQEAATEWGKIAESSPVGQVSTSMGQFQFGGGQLDRIIDAGIKVGETNRRIETLIQRMGTVVEEIRNLGREGDFA